MPLRRHWGRRRRKPSGQRGIAAGGRFGPTIRARRSAWFGGGVGWRQGVHASGRRPRGRRRPVPGRKDPGTPGVAAVHRGWNPPGIDPSADVKRPPQAGHLTGCRPAPLRTGSGDCGAVVPEEPAPWLPAGAVPATTPQRESVAHGPDGRQPAAQRAPPSARRQPGFRRRTFRHPRCRTRRARVGLTSRRASPRPPPQG